MGCSHLSLFACLSVSPTNREGCEGRDHPFPSLAQFPAQGSRYPLNSLLRKAGAGENEDAVDRVRYQERVHLVGRSHLQGAAPSPLHGAGEGAPWPLWSCQALQKCPGPGCMALCKSFLSLASVFPAVQRGGDWATSPRVFQSCYVVTMIKP